MRKWLLGIGFAITSAGANQPPVDLGAAGVLDRIQAEDPVRYEKIVRIMAIAGDVSCETLPGLLKVQFAVTAAQCNGYLLLTSQPAKRHLNFTLEDTSYVVNVVVAGPRATLRPAKPEPHGRLTPLTRP